MNWRGPGLVFSFEMIGFLAFAGLLAAAGLAFFSLIGLVFFIIKMALWTVLLPIRILFKVLMIPVALTFGAIGLAAGAAAIPILLVVVAAVVVVGAIAALLALLVPAIPFILLGLAIWALVRKRPATA